MIKIIWTEKIPKKPGIYLTKGVIDGIIMSLNITKLDLQVQETVDNFWLNGCYYSTQPIQEEFKNEIENM